MQMIIVVYIYRYIYIYSSRVRSLRVAASEAYTNFILTVSTGRHRVICQNARIWCRISDPMAFSTFLTISSLFLVKYPLNQLMRNKLLKPELYDLRIFAEVFRNVNSAIKLLH